MWSLPRKQARTGPLYKEVISLIEQAVQNGLLNGGDKLPSERHLSDLLGVHRSTVIHALDNLSDRGVLIRRRGSGTYVNHEKWGLQQYPIFNWQPPTSLISSRDSDRHHALVSRYRNEASRKGAPFLDLSVSDLSTPLLPSMTMPEKTWPELLNQELDAESSLTGVASLKEAVRKHLRDCLKLDADPGRILITSGAQQALFLITQCLLRPGDAVGIESPSYFYSLPVFQAAGLRLFPIPTDAGGVIPDGLDALAALRGLKVIFLNPVFQNPTGHNMSAARKKAVFEFCAARHIPIVEDDAYSLLALADGMDVSPIKGLDRHGQVLYVGSLTSYAGRNLRAGWLVAPENVVRRLAEVRRQMDAGLSVLPQLLAAHYLQSDFDGHRVRIRAALSEKAACLQRWLAEACPGLFTWREPGGGFYLYLDSREGSSPGTAEELLKRGIVPARGADFGDTQGRYRLNFAHFLP